MRINILVILFYVSTQFGCLAQSSNPTKGCIEYHPIPQGGPIMLFFNEEYSLYVSSSTKLGPSSVKSGVRQENGQLSVVTVFEDEDGSQVYRDFADSSITVRQTKGYFPAYAYNGPWRFFLKPIVDV